MVQGFNWYKGSTGSMVQLFKGSRLQYVTKFNWINVQLHGLIGSRVRLVYVLNSFKDSIQGFNMFTGSMVERFNGQNRFKLLIG